MKTSQNQDPDSDRERGQGQIFLVAGLLVTAVVLLRVLPHPWNVTPLTALALFSGAQLRTRLGWALLVALLFLSDLVLGWHPTMPFTWGAFLLIQAMGTRLRDVAAVGSWIGMSLAASVFFYIVTNAGVFAVTDLYPKNWAGLGDCYVMALPFFRNALIGDLVYTSALFGIYHAAMNRKLAHAHPVR